MAIKPRPELIQCPKCSWQVTYAPRSDALIEPRPDECPKCGNVELTVKPAGLLEVAISSIASRLNKG